MPDERKTEAELLQELDLLRRRVAELEQSQQAVEHSEKQFGELFENASVGVYRTTPDGRIIMANPALVHMLGYSSFEQLSQRNLEKEGFAPGYPRSLFKDLIEKNGRVANLESAWLRHDGTTVFVSEHGGVVRDKSGKALYYEGIVQDITERKKVEAALKESEAKYRDLVEEMSDIIYTVDAQGILTSVNKAVRTVSGHDPAEIIGRHFTSFLMPDCIPEVTVAFKRVLAGKSVTMETTALDSSAQQFHVEVSSIPVIKDGVVVGARGIIRDITERKKFELELRESREKYRELVDNINDGVYQTDTRGNFTYVNKIIEQRTGIPAEKFVGLNFRDIVLPEYHEVVRENLTRFLAGEQVPPFELEYRTATGQTIAVETNVRPIYDGNTIIGIQGITRDITARKQAEEKLKDSEATLRSIIDAATESVLLMQIDGTILAANRAAAERLGTTLGELIGKCAYDFIPDDIADSRKLQVEKVIHIGQPLIFEDVWGVRHILHSLSPIKDSAGKVAKLAIFGFDITERKRLEQALRGSELRYRSLFESSPVGLGLATTDGKILDCNSAMLAMMGYLNSEIGQVNLKDTYVNLQERARLLKELETSGLVRDFQVQLKRKDGTTYWANLTVIPFPFAGENTILTAAVDITAQRQMQQALRQSENKYKTLLENLPQRIFLKDTNSVYLSCNQNYARDLGIKAHQIAGKTDYDFYSKEMAEKYRADDRQIVESGQTTDIEEKYILPGQESIVHTVKTPVRDEQGNVTGILGIFWDITEQKKVQQALITRDKAIASAIYPIAFSDEHGILTYVNEAFLKTLRYQDARQILGKSIIEFAQNKDEAIKAMQLVLTTGSLVGEIGAVRSDGSPIEVQISASVVRDEDGRIICLMGSFMDITESRQKERELNLYREKIAQAEQLASLGTLSASLAHQLTQPLTTIRLSIENSLAELEATSCPGDVLEGLNDGLEGVEYAVSIIDRFRNFARQSSEKILTEVNLMEVAERILRLLDKNARQANISLRLKDLEKLPPIYAHEKDMEQLFFALVDNAIHAADGKKKCQLTISGAVKGEHVELWFADDCGGIAPENLDKIFEPFFTTRPAGEGTGLGLPIVQHIVFRAGGKIWVQNKPGKGATFFATLPISKGIGS